MDAYSGYILVKFVHRKSKAEAAVREMIQELKELFCEMNEKLTSVHCSIIRWLHADERGELVGHKFQKWLQQRHIKNHVETSYLPQSNGWAERLDQTLLEMAKNKVLNKKTLDERLYVEVIATAHYVENRLGAKICKAGCTTIEAIHKNR